ncbi:MAG: ROK family protein [Hyphomicrobiaceae bacterium]
MSLRIGVDLGGTKIAARCLMPTGLFGPEFRVPTPRHDYAATIKAIVELVGQASRVSVAPVEPYSGRGANPGGGFGVRVGVAIPGSEAPGGALIQNANSTWLNGRPFRTDLEAALGLPVRLANDADCFALSEATDGTARGARTMVGLILGTGCGAGIVIEGRLLNGPRGTAGEWGHTPLPNPTADEQPGPMCWCGRRGCLETWIAGPAIARDHEQVTGESRDVTEIVSAAEARDPAARATLHRHLHRTARGLAVLTNILDPDVIVIGGGLSNLPGFCDNLATAIVPHIFANDQRVRIIGPKWGDASGARGAAWLWPTEG